MTSFKVCVMVMKKVMINDVILFSDPGTTKDKSGKSLPKNSPIQN
jgi:hypothetical protein